MQYSVVSVTGDKINFRPPTTLEWPGSGQMWSGQQWPPGAPQGLYMKTKTTSTVASQCQRRDHKWCILLLGTQGNWTTIRTRKTMSGSDKARPRKLRPEVSSPFGVVETLAALIHTPLRVFGMRGKLTELMDWQKLEVSLINRH